MARYLSIRPFKFVKRYMPKNLFGRTLTILLTPVIIIMLVITFVFFDRHWSGITHRFAEDIAGDIAVIIHVVEDGKMDFPKAQEMAQKHFDMIVNRGNKLEYYGHSSVILREMGADYLTDSLKKQGITQQFHVGLDSDYVYVSIQRGEEIFNFVVNRKRLLSKTTTVFLLWLFGAPLLLLIIAIVFLRNQIRPILRLAVAVDRFGKGKDVSGFKPEGASEVRKAAVAFNQMRERIRRQISQRTEMLAGVSHDLRTPLTRMKLQIAMLEDKAAKSGLSKDVNDMTSMVEAFLEFAKNNEQEKEVNTPVRKFLNSIIEPYGIESKIDIPRDLKIQLRCNHFKRAIVNLLDNAQKYATKTTLTAKCSDQYIKIYIDDNGPGIEESKRNDVFKPFYRQDKSRNLDVNGLGLGLSIAQDSIYQHGGTIRLSDSKLGGLRVEVIIPM